MDFRRLKELVGRLGGILVLDGEEPEFVILSYRQYEKIEAGEEVRLSTSSKMYDGAAETNSMASAVADKDVGDEDEQEAVEKLNQEILALKEEIRLKEEAELQGGEHFGRELSAERFVEPVENEQPAEPVAKVVDFD